MDDLVYKGHQNRGQAVTCNRQDLENVNRDDTEQKPRRPTCSRRHSNFLVCAGSCEGFLDLYNIPFFGVGRRPIF